jgi:small-conductance mechanosensitive channel
MGCQNDIRRDQADSNQRQDGFHCRAFFGKLIYGVILAFVVIAAIGKLGVQTTSLVAIFGAATLAVGMALQAPWAISLPE